MTKKEALQILAILKAAYPSSYNGMTKEEATGTVAVWCMQFQDIPAPIVMMAIHKLISTNKFPPSISEVKGKIGTIHWEAYEMLSSVPFRDMLSDGEREQYERIYQATKAYKTPNCNEPNIEQLSRIMLRNGGEPLKIGNGGEQT